LHKSLHHRARFPYKSSLTRSYSGEGSAAAWQRKELVSERLKQAVIAPLYGVDR